MNSQPMNAKGAKTMRAKVLETYPNLQKHMEEVWPKKASVLEMKLKGEEWTYVRFIRVDDEMLFIEFKDKEKF